MANPYRMSITDLGRIINGQGGKDSDVMARVGVIVCGSGAWILTKRLVHHQFAKILKRR